MAASMTCGGLLRSSLTVKLPEKLFSGFIQVRHRQKKNVRYRDPHESNKGGNQPWRPKKYVLESKPKDTSRADSPAWRNKVPSDDVWIRLYYPKQPLSLEETIVRHREYAVPEILDSLHSLIYADMMLDMKTAKKTKFLSQVKGTVHVPHGFEDQQQKRCIVFCEKAEDVEKALELGAVAAGGQDLVKKLLEDEIGGDDFEFVLTTPDFLTQLISVRSLLKDRFPIKQKGNLSSDIEGMMSLFAKGMSYKSQRISTEEGRLQVPFGQLNMPTDHLVGNFMEVVKSVCSHRPLHLGPMITKVQIVCPPSEERFTLQLEGVVPGYVSDRPVKPATEEHEPEVEVDSDDEAAVSAKS